MIEPLKERKNPLWLDVGIVEVDECLRPSVEVCESCLRNKNMCVVRGFLRKSNIGHFFIAKCSYRINIL